MFKLITIAALASLLAACSGMSAPSGQSTMGASPGSMQNGSGPANKAGDGPN